MTPAAAGARIGSGRGPKKTDGTAAQPSRRRRLTPHHDARNGGTSQINGPSELLAWDWPAGTERFRLALDGPAGPFVFTADGKQIVVPGFRTKGAADAAVLDARTGDEVAQLRDAGDFPALADGGKMLYVGRWNGATAWDPATWVAKPEPKFTAARVLAADPFTGLLATVELSSGPAVLFDPNAGQPVARLDAHSGPVQALAFDEKPLGWGVTSVTPIADECTVYETRTGQVLWSGKGSIWRAEFAAGGAVLLQTGPGERVDGEGGGRPAGGGLVRGVPAGRPGRRPRGRPVPLGPPGDRGGVGVAAGQPQEDGGQRPGGRWRVPRRWRGSVSRRGRVPSESIPG